MHTGISFFLQKMTYATCCFEFLLSHTFLWLKHSSPLLYFKWPHSSALCGHIVTSVYLHLSLKKNLKEQCQ